MPYLAGADNEVGAGALEAAFLLKQRTYAFFMQGTICLTGPTGRDDPDAYKPDPATMEALTAQSKPWFPYNPKDANPEDELSDHEAEVDISDIHIPGKRHKALLHT